MLKKPIKASQIANLTDARYFAAWEVNWLGFCLDTTADHFLQPAELVAIRAWVEGPKIVGEFGFMPIEDLLELTKLMKLDAIQVGPFYQAEDLAQLKGLTIFQEIIIEPDVKGQDLLAQLQKAAPYVNYFLLNFSKNNQSLEQLRTSDSFTITDLKNMTAAFSILLDLHLPAADVESFLEETGVHGLSLKGGEEEKVGVKSFDELDEVFEALEIFV